MNKKLVVILLCLILGTALFLKIRDSLPVVRANGVNLTYESYRKNKEGLIRFRDLNKSNVSDSDIEKGIIFSFVEDALTQKELEKYKITKDTEDKVVNDTIKENKDKLEKSVSNLYGWSLAEFGDYVLYPQARKILLNEALEKDKRDPQKWLEKSLGEANISVYLLKWKWSDGELKKRF